jgi:hypothetical protein
MSKYKMIGMNNTHGERRGLGITENTVNEQSNMPR